MTTTLARRTEPFGETIFSEISALALAHGAINLGQGFPDFAPPPFVLEAARASLEAEHQQYARGAGHLPLAEAIAEEASASLGRALDPANEITITVGATEGIFASMLALLDPGDEVVLLEPFYDSYPASARIAGAVPRYVPLRPGADGRWQLDPDELRRAFSPRTKLLVLNTPHNPTGKVFSREELELCAGLCLEHDTLALCDEVYEHLLYDGRAHLRLASLPGMWERTVTLSSAGKSFSVTGWKIGWAIASARLSLGIRRLHQWIPFAVATPLQAAVARALRAARARGYHDELRTFYTARREQLCAILANAGLRPLVPEGAYYVIADTSGLGFEDDTHFCRHLTTVVGVAAIPPSAFYSAEHQGLARQLARFCFCKRAETLAAAGERLRAAWPARRGP